jgi:hypothetical protein
MLDLIGVALVGVIGAITIYGVQSKSAGNRVLSVLEFLNLDLFFTCNKIKNLDDFNKYQERINQTAKEFEKYLSKNDTHIINLINSIKELGNDFLSNAFYLRKNEESKPQEALNSMEMKKPTIIDDLTGNYENDILNPRLFNFINNVHESMVGEGSDILTAAI